MPSSFFGGTFGHGDGANDGFVRADSVLAVVVVTDKDDCSALDGELYNPASATYGATDLNLRCFAHGDAALHPISRYVDGLLQLRRHPSRLVYALIAGVPTDLVTPSGSPDWDLLIGPPGTRDLRMEENIDPVAPNRLVPSCDEPGRGTAFPPIRLLRVGRDPASRGAGVTVQSICQHSYAPVIREVVRRIAD